MTETITSTETSYDILRPLGSGGMGQVFLVQSPRQPKPVALKLLQLQWMNDSRVDAFKREFTLLTELHHPYLCRAYDFGFTTSHQQYFFTSEYVEGEQVYQALRNGTLPEIQMVMAQMLSALDFLHSTGLVHFDVKGDNVIVTHDSDGSPIAKLVDFGVTSPAHRQLTEIAGTVNYIAPELLLPNPTADGRCDLYSFGVLCYYLLAGRLPYTVNSFDEVWAWHRANPQLDCEPFRERGVPEYLCQMVARLLRPSPSERFSSAAVALNYLTLHAAIPAHQLPTAQRARIAEGPFVGRADLIATIRHALKATSSSVRTQTVRNGIERTFIVVGLEGMGKSRLLHELKYTAQLAGYAVLMMQGSQEGERWDRFCQPLGLDPAVATVESVEQELMQRARAQPLCCFIDNLHTAAPIVQQCLHGVMGMLYSASLTHEAPPLVLVATVSPRERPMHPGGAVTMELGPLNRSDVDAYLRQLLGSPEDFEPLRDAVWNFSGGVPLLMVEAARSYHHHDALPKSIDELYRGQIGRLTDTARRVLELLAFADRPLPYKLVKQLISPTAERDVAELRQEALIQHHGETDCYVVATGALGTCVRSTLSEATRTQLADALIAWLIATPHTTAVDIAAYAPFATNKEAACGWLTKAAETAEGHGHAPQAIAHWVSVAALRTVMQMPQAVIQIRRKIGTLQLYQGEYEACEATVHCITQLTGTPEPPELKMMGLLCRVRRKPYEAMQYYERALQVIPADVTDPIYLTLENERAQAYLEAGRVHEAIPLLTMTHGATKTLPEATRQQVTNNNLGAALAREGHYNEAIIFYHEKMAQFPNDHRLQGSIYSQLAMTQIAAGKIADAIQSFERAWEIALSSGDLHSAPVLLENLIALLQKQATYSRALTFAKKSLALKSMQASDHEMGRSLMTLATLYLNLGCLDVAARHLVQAMRIVRRSRDHQLRGWIHITFGYLNKYRGDLMESLNAFEETIDIGEQHHDEELIRWGRYGAADVLLDHGSMAEATELTSQLEPMVAHVTDPEFLTRYAMVRHRIAVLKEPTPSHETATALLALVQECTDAGWVELQWEVEHLLGICHQKRQEVEVAQTHLHNAAALIRTLAEGLDEEFRDSFLKMKPRARVLAELRAIERHEVYITGVTQATSASSSVTPSGTAVRLRKGSRKTQAFRPAKN